MLYRSPVTRWLLAVAGFAAGLVFLLGNADKWRSTPSFDWLAKFPIPLQLWGVGFIVYAALLLTVRTRPVGFAAGAFLFAVFAISLIATLGQSGPKNTIVIAALVDVVVFHLFSIKAAWAVRLAQ